MVVPVDEVSRLDEGVEKQVRAFAMVRVGLGVMLLLVPGAFLRCWLGSAADRPVSRMLTRYVGGRDLALGLGTMFALKHDAPVRGWLEAGAVADATDFVATTLAVRRLPRLPAAASALAALGGVAFGRQLVGRLPSRPSSQ